MCFFSPFKKYKKELSSLYAKKHEIENRDNYHMSPGDEMDQLISQIDALIEGDYAKAVFDYYKEKAPLLIRIRTGEEISWKEAFGDSFDDVSKSLRHSLVGLVEGDGRYRIK